MYEVANSSRANKLQLFSRNHVKNYDKITFEQ